MILYMAALQGVSKDLEDAARIDGAKERQVITRITLPMMGPTIRLTIYLSVLGSLQQFVLVWIMTPFFTAKFNFLVICRLLSKVQSGFVTVKYPLLLSTAILDDMCFILACRGQI